jgi:cellobiose-specific phosphotransferase system component IIC
MATTPTPAVDKASSQAVTALILGILGILCCQLLAPIAWYLGNQELRSIKEGRSAAAGQGFASAGKIMGIIGTVLFVLSLIWIFGFGGLAIIEAMREAGG